MELLIPKCIFIEVKAISDKTHFTTKIPTKPHLRLFLLEFYPEPYVLNRQDSLGLHLYQILRNRSQKSRTYDSLKECTVDFTIYVSRNYALEHGCRILSSHQIHLFNLYLKQKLLDHSVTFIESAEHYGATIKEAIYNFMGRYDLKDGERVDTKSWYQRLQKNYYRHRKMKENSRNHPSLSPLIIRP